MSQDYSSSLKLFSSTTNSIKKGGVRNPFGLKGIMYSPFSSVNIIDNDTSHDKLDMINFFETDSKVRTEILNEDKDTSDAFAKRIPTVREGDCRFGKLKDGTEHIRSEIKKYGLDKNTNIPEKNLTSEKYNSYSNKFVKGSVDRHSPKPMNALTGHDNLKTLQEKNTGEKEKFIPKNREKNYLI